MVSNPQPVRKGPTESAAELNRKNLQRFSDQSAMMEQILRTTGERDKDLKGYLRARLGDTQKSLYFAQHGEKVLPTEEWDQKPDAFQNLNEYTG